MITPKLRLTGALFCLLPVAVQAQAYTWSTFAGLPPLSGNADGRGENARFLSPRAVAAAPEGIVFVADTGNGLIRRISADGTVTTIAGTPSVAGTFEGPAATVRFANPTGVIHHRGLLFVADGGSHSIRTIDAQGSVGTFAGANGQPGFANGTGTSARFAAPGGLAIDPAGNLFVADTGNHAIRRVSPAGEVTTVAGVPGQFGSADGPANTARFALPSAVSVAPNGDLYVTDTGNHLVRRIAANGTVATVAGSPGATGGVNGQGAAARFQLPVGVVALANGNVLVSDYADAVRLVAPDRSVSTFAGRLNVPGSRDGSLAESRFNNPFGLALDGDTVLIADSDNNAIRRLDLAGGTIAKLAGSPDSFSRGDGNGMAARFDTPMAIAGHESGDLYVADSRGPALRRIGTDGTVVLVAGGPTDAYVDGPAGTASLNYPAGIAVAPDRTVYFSEGQLHTIRVLRPDGSVATLAGQENAAGAADGPGASARFNTPGGLALDRNGILYVADAGNHAVRRIDPESGVVSTFVGALGTPGSNDGNRLAARLRGPRGLAFGRDDSLWIADTGNNIVRRIPAGGDVATVAGLAGSAGAVNGRGSAARFLSPTALAIDAAGLVYVADLGNAIVRRIEGDVVVTIGGLVTRPGFRDGDSAQFNLPSGVAVGRDGAIYVTEAGNNTVRRGVRSGPPVILGPPQSVVASAGDTVVFSVLASGGSMSYQWRFRGFGIPGAIRSTLVVPNVNGINTGDYSVVVANAFGTTESAEARLSLVSTPDAGRIVNLSILTAIAAPGDNFTLGFVVGGGAGGSKPLVLRAAGPSLGALGVPDTLADPKLEWYFGTASAGTNDNWGGAPALAAAMGRVGAFAYTGPGSADAALLGDFRSGNNSVKISSAGSGTGTVIAEIYDATPAGSFGPATPRLANVSVLKPVGPVLIAGFAIGGRTSRTVLVRAVGITLGEAPFGIVGTVADPALTLYSGAHAIAANDNWGGSADLRAVFAKVGAFDLPSASSDAALLATLAPGPYTVQVKGVTGGGTALVEIYEVP